MTLSTQPLPSIGAPNSTEDAKIRSLLSEIQGIVNGGIDTSNLAAAAGVTEAQLAAVLVSRLGVGTTGRGKSIIATSESRTNTAYGTLTTPDKVTVTLPADGLIVATYQATWQESVSGAARAAFFIGANQQVMQSGTSQLPAPVAAATGSSTAARDYPLVSSGGGLMSVVSTSGGFAADLTTGQAVGAYGTTVIEETTVARSSGASLFYAGGPCHIFAAAGTYDVTVQFKASSGSVSAKNRKLWCWTMGF
jgi:hypothetical protein